MNPHMVSVLCLQPRSLNKYYNTNKRILFYSSIALPKMYIISNINIMLEYEIELNRKNPDCKRYPFNIEWRYFNVELYFAILEFKVNTKQ